MKVIIIEDERPAAEKLKKAILQFDPTIEVTGLLSSVQSAVEWFGAHAMPDLVFMDIELSDGLSFKIFDAVNITCPVIFTTAFDEYWQEAFEYNSIDYLLKPVREEKLASAFKKFHQLQRHFSAGLQQLLQWQKNGGKDPHRKRFLVKRGAEYITVSTEEIAYFYTTHKLVCLVDKANRKFILDKSLTELEEELDSSRFYRVNRKYLVHLNSIIKIRSLPRSRLHLELAPALSEEIIISQENVSGFKQWMEG